jgi:RNA polymerase sigma-70 factor (ECF subfamily)
VSQNNSIDLEKVVSEFYEALFRFGYSLAKSEEGASELTQQTILILIRNKDKIRDAERIKSWLFTTLHREFLKQKRRSQPWQDFEPEFIESIPDNSLTNQARQLQAKEAMELLHCLDPVFREPLALFYLEGFAYKEIAAILEIPIGTVMSRLARGKELLKSQLTEKSGNKPRV